MHIIKFCQRVALAIGIGMLVLPAVLVAADPHNQRGALRGGAGREQRNRVRSFLARNLRAVQPKQKCVICQDKIEERFKFVLPCRHAYHKTCITSWLKISMTCPLCKRAMLPETMQALGIAGDYVWKMKVELFKAVQAGNLLKVQEVLAGGWVDHNCRSLQMLETPLHMAARCGYLDIVAWLLQQPGILIDAIDTFGKTSLINAYQAGQMVAVEMLLAAGANPFLAAYGFTLLYLAANDGNEALLTRLLADPRLTLEKLNVPAGIAQETPLMAACKAGSATMVRKLLAAGADPAGAKNIHRRTTLNLAREGGNPEVAKLIEAAIVGRALLRSGRDDS